MPDQPVKRGPGRPRKPRPPRVTATDFAHALPPWQDLVEQPDAETRAARIAAATLLALQGLPGIGELRALDILLEHTHRRLLEIQALTSVQQ